MKAIYIMNLDFGRMGVLEGTFTATKQQVEKLTGDTLGVYWGDNYRYSTDNYDKYFTNGETVWEVFDHVDTEDDGYFIKVSDNNDGTYSFATTFYNGGTCLGEILEEEISKL